jgi:hypothetical protein
MGRDISSGLRQNPSDLADNCGVIVPGSFYEPVLELSQRCGAVDDPTETVENLRIARHDTPFYLVSRVMSIIRLDSFQLCKLFNETGYFERAQRGELLRTLVRAGTPGPEYNQPPGTISETWWWHESRGTRLVRVAVVHQFVLPDGRINNAVGRPDPKWFRTDAGTFATLEGRD